MASAADAAPQLDLDSRKGRYGVVYLDAVVTAAGYDLNEPRAGADMLAYDASITVPEGHVRVQIKTTHSESIGGTNARLSYTAKQHWVDKWAQAQAYVPVYFVVVVVPVTVEEDVSGHWLNHHPAGTDLLGTAAYWSRIDVSTFTPANMSVAALRSQRFDGETVTGWRQDLRAMYGASGA